VSSPARSSISGLSASSSAIWPFDGEFIAKLMKGAHGLSWACVDGYSSRDMLFKTQEEGLFKTIRRKLMVFLGKYEKEVGYRTI